MAPLVLGERVMAHSSRDHDGCDSDRKFEATDGHVLGIPIETKPERSLSLCLGLGL